jgi:hypothetical protein
LLGALSFGVAACCSGGRAVKPEDAIKAEATCRAKPSYSPTLSASMKADLDGKCAAAPGGCSRFRGSIAGVCAYQNPRAKVALSDRVEVYATLGARDDLALKDLCVAMRSVAGVGFLQDIEIWIARDKEPFWGKSWRLRCAQGSGSGNEHR